MHSLGEATEMLPLPLLLSIPPPLGSCPFQTQPQAGFASAPGAAAHLADPEGGAPFQRIEKGIGYNCCRCAFWPHIDKIWLPYDSARGISF
jgi:hypothetical protein